MLKEAARTKIRKPKITILTYETETKRRIGFDDNGPIGLRHSLSQRRTALTAAKKKGGGLVFFLLPLLHTLLTVLHHSATISQQHNNEHGHTTRTN